MESIFILFLSLISLASCQLVLKACCGDENCAQFTRPEQMYGMTCCGDAPINQFEKICCANVTKNRQQGGNFVDRCCGNETLNYDQTCCEAVVHNIPNGECCGVHAYTRNTFNVLCCNGTLYRNVEPGSTCCGNTPYDGGVMEICCGEQVYKKESFDGCCPVPETSPLSYRPFHSRTHLCCDKPIPRDSTTKCCYLRSNNGTMTPKSYDYASWCCTYPYEKFTEKTNGVCIGTPRVTKPKDEDET